MLLLVDAVSVVVEVWAKFGIISILVVSMNSNTKRILVLINM